MLVLTVYEVMSFKCRHVVQRGVIIELGHVQTSDVDITKIGKLSLLLCPLKLAAIDRNIQLVSLFTVTRMVKKLQSVLSH